MPRTPDYSQSIIYKLVRKSGKGDFYIGSTTNLLQREKDHKKACLNPDHKEHNAVLYQHIRNNYGWSSWKIVPIEQFPCENKTELDVRKRYWIDLIQPTLNDLIPPSAADLVNGREEWNKQKARERDRMRVRNEDYKLTQAIWRINNKERIRAYNSELVKCDCGQDVRREYLLRHQRTAKHQKAVQCHHAI